MNSVAIGGSSEASGYSAMALGVGNMPLPDIDTIDGTYDPLCMTAMITMAQGKYSLAMAGGVTGEEAVRSISIGSLSEASGNGAIAIGVIAEEELDDYFNNPHPKNTAASGDYSIAAGTNANASAAYATAIGKNSRAAAENSLATMGASVSADAKEGLAFGNGASVTLEGGVALGSGAVSSTAKGIAGYDPSTKAASADTAAAWKSTAAAVSVGDAGNTITRQITGVAAGSADTDAVNVAQLKKAVIDAAGDGNDTLKESTNGLALSQDGKTLSLAVEDTAGKKVTGSVDLSGLKDGNDTLKESTNGLSLSDDGKTLSLAVEDTAGKKVTGSVDLSGLKDGNDTLKESTNGLSLSDDGKTLSLAVEDTAGKKVTGSVDLSDIADGNDTLVSSSDTLAIADGKLTMTVKDTAGNEAKGSVNISDIADGNTTYEITGKENDDNTTTITPKGSDNKESSVTIASKDPRNTVKAGDHMTVSEADQADGSKEYTLSVKTDGTVTSGNTGIVTGGTVHKETRVASDGYVTKKENTAGENISALDRQVKENADSIKNIGGNVSNINGSLRSLKNRINRVGAGAAALAALHPQDFNPDDKWDFAVGYGNYKDANAVAVGTFYRPSEDVMLSVGGSFGGGENMVNAGLSFKLGQTRAVGRSKIAMAKEILELKKQNQSMQKELDEIKMMLRSGDRKIIGDINFPDVPKDHWAYGYVKYLADRGYVIGYPDGLFKGDRAMTRYEYAAIVYRALQNGAPVDADMGRSLGEFGPEIEKIAAADRFRVDRTKGEDSQRDKVERIRVNDKDNPAENIFRDVYGSYIEKEAAKK